jgi:hypothetical protein
MGTDFTLKKGQLGCPFFLMYRRLQAGLLEVIFLFWIVASSMNWNESKKMRYAVMV